jgi:ABC-2 type transport system ATP-binding protein
MAAVDVESLTITYGNVTAVDDLSFRAEAGEVTCVLGPNGAGKTSTLESLEGLRRPSAGRLRVIGLDPHAEHAALTERIGVMLQEGGVHPAVRVGEVLRHAAALYSDPLDPRDLIERLGLAGLERRTYRQLSGGEQQRVALALALVGRPQVAFLDEPTAGVDPAGRQVIRQVVADLRNDGVAVLLTTHDLDEAERVADRVVIVVDGRLVGAGTVDELTRASGGNEQVRFRAPAGLDRDSLVRHLGGTTVVEVAPGEYVVAAEPTPRTVAAITAWLAEHDLPLADLRAGRQRLEDVYLRLTAEHAEPVAPEAGTRSRSSGLGDRNRAQRRSDRDGAEHDRAEVADRDDPDTLVDDGPATSGAIGLDAAAPAEPGPVPSGTQPDPDSGPTSRSGTDVSRGAPPVGERSAERPSEGGSTASRPQVATRGRPAEAGDDTAAPGRPSGTTRGSDDTIAPDRLAATPHEPTEPHDRTVAPTRATGHDAAGRPDDEGLTPSTFEAFWGRGRFKGGADQPDDTAWEGWASGPGDAGATPATGRTPTPDGTDASGSPDHPGDTDDPGRTDERRRGRRWRR